MEKALNSCGLRAFNIMKSLTISKGMIMDNDISSSEEVFKTIAGYPRYQVSNFGRVKSLAYNKERILKHGINSRGYPTLSLFINSKSHSITVHKLVSRTFIGEPNGLDVDHIDEDKTNNNLSNLRYLSRRENVSRSIKRKNLEGVSFSRNTTHHKKPWRSQIIIKGKSVFLGYFPTEIEAHAAYIKIREEL